MKKIGKIFAILLLLLLLSLAALYMYLLYLVPANSGTQQLAGLRDSVEVYFDPYGIPHIYAQNEEDAYRALGYLHAQERLFQMEILRRLVTGRLAEVLGPDLVPIDRFFRALSVPEAAKQNVATHFKTNTLPYQKAANAYIEGVNRYIAEGKTPIEFTILGIPKETFTPNDLYHVMGYMAFSFAQAFRTDPLLTDIAQRFGEGRLQELAIFGDSTMENIRVHRPTDSLTALRAVAPMATEVHQLLNTYLSLPLLHGSNGWAIAPQKSANGRAILSNDTHIGYAQPAVWFEAHIECPNFGFYGNYLAGLPFAPLGHNRRIAWGLTMFENDDIDFFREKTNPENANQVWAVDHWENLEIRNEIIRIKGAKDTTIQIRKSRHGYILNDHLVNATGLTYQGDYKNDQPIAVAWTFHSFPTTVLQGAYQMAHAQNLKDAQDAVKLMDVPGLNVMYADAEGNVAWWAAAKLPIRQPHVNPMVVLDGASGKDDWQGFYQFFDNPTAINPSWGYVYSANNQPDKYQNSIYHPGYYLAEDRAFAIRQLLDSKDKWTLDDVKTMINSDTSPIAAKNVQRLLQLLGQKAPAHAALEVLKKWNGAHDINQIAPTIYYKWIYLLNKEIFADELGEAGFEVMLETHVHYRSMAKLLANDTAAWHDDVRTPARENLSVLAERSLKTALADLEKELGADVNQWQWQKVHTIEHQHLIGRQAPLNHLFNVGPFSVSGGKEVINNLSFTLNSSGKYAVKAGPAMRRIIDMGDPENSWSVLPTGESGYFLSKHYDDQAEMFNTGKFRKQLMNKKEIQTTAEGKMWLVPQQ
jgi:penicillin amidase